MGSSLSLGTNCQWDFLWIPLSFLVKRFCFDCSNERLPSNLNFLNSTLLYLTEWKCGIRTWVCSQSCDCGAFVLRKSYARELWIEEKLTSRLGWGLTCKAEESRVPGLHSLPLWRSWVTNAIWAPFKWNLKQLLDISNYPGIYNCVWQNTWLTSRSWVFDQMLGVIWA